MVQTRWGYLNEDYSILTKTQAFALNAHFTLEQVGRNNKNHFMNFNGTAGVWRKKTIIDAQKNITKQPESPINSENSDKIKIKDNNLKVETLDNEKKSDNADVKKTKKVSIFSKIKNLTSKKTK